MNILKKTAILAATLLAIAPCGSYAQENSFPEGATVYSLPSTALCLQVTAQKENFLAGPYAKYAQKYLGSPARTTDAVNWTLKEISLSAKLTADNSEMHSVRLSAANATSSAMFQFCSQGLVVLSDSGASSSEIWRFPSAADKRVFNTKDRGENLTNATATLYKNVQTEAGFSKVAVQQSEVVEKSLDKKAADAAQQIFELRKCRTQMITGDADANFSGEALGAALAEIARLEDEYLSLFYGISQMSDQTMNFDVVPVKSNAKQMYIAFRVDEKEGLLPASGSSGRPVILTLTVEDKIDIDAATAGFRAKSSGQLVYYRIPVTATVRLMDGQNTLIQTRMPIFQLGEKASIPLESSR